MMSCAKLTAFFFKFIGGFAFIVAGASFEELCIDFHSHQPPQEPSCQEGDSLEALRLCAPASVAVRPQAMWGGAVNGFA